MKTIQFFMSICLLMTSVPVFAKSTFPAPTFRQFLNMLPKMPTAEEMRGLEKFAVEHGFNLDQPMPLEFKGDRVFISGKELSFEASAHKLIYASYRFGAEPAKSLDIRVREIFGQLQGAEKASAWSLLMPAAHADKRGLGVDAMIGGGAAVAIGVMCGLIGSFEGYWARTALAVYIAAGTAVYLAGLILVLLTGPAESGELRGVMSASCDKNGFMMKVGTTTSSTTILAQDKAGELVTSAKDENGHEISADEKTKLMAAMPKGLEMARQCQAHPLPAADFTQALQTLYQHSLLRKPGEAKPAAGGGAERG